MISTWDGDEYAFSAFNRHLAKTLTNSDRESIIHKFEIAIKSYLKKHKCKINHLHRGNGSFSGILPIKDQHYFKQLNDEWIFCPSLKNMKTFIDMKL